MHRRRDILAHKVRFPSLRVESLIVPDIEPTAEDVSSAQRLLTAYRRSEEDARARQEVTRTDLWSRIRSEQFSFISVLDRQDPVALAAYLCNMNRQDATTGTVQGNLEYQKVHSNRSYRRFISLMTKDKLVSLAEAVGAIPCENPEQGMQGANLRLDADWLVDRIERSIGVDITPPNIDGGLLKIRTSQALFNERDLNSIYTAWYLSTVSKTTTNPSICEIGAGSGRLVYWSWRFGCGSYTAFDLPHINVIQGFYLVKSLPGVPIALYGEPVAKEADKGITILPHWKIHDIAGPRFDLIVNQDSFPEIHEEAVRKYLERIRILLRGYLVSINHESRPRGVNGTPQLNVPALIAELGGFDRIARSPYWLRRGYVLELYALN